MAGLGRNDPKKLTSLLLQPPNSSFSWNDVPSGNILMPVTQTEPVNEAGTDTFLGQEPSQYLQASEQAATELVPTGSFSQLQQPLRPPLQSQVPSDGPTAAPAPLEPPPIGPPMNFHRQSPLVHASLQALCVPGPPAPGPPVDQPRLPCYPSFEQPVSPPAYTPVRPHWFYSREIEQKLVWMPFSLLDSTSLEEAFGTGNDVVTTDGGRYDVDVGARLRRPVYWEETASQVRRCTWFYKLEGQNRFVPYEEPVASVLEEHYRQSMATGSWHQRLELPGNQTVVMHNSSVMVHFLPSSHLDEWGNVSEGQSRPRVVKRGVTEVDTIEEGEPSQIDHLVFVVHGVGSVCDFRFRSVEECLDDIRHIALGLIRSHFGGPLREGHIGRVEFLPVSWHSTLHSDATGIDQALRHITLRSIPKLRHFTNDTLLDILFYTSPVYCQTIVDTVGSEMNRLHSKFMERNPGFSGTIALAGHSLGSLILYDILSHQGDTADVAEVPAAAEQPGDPSVGSLFRELMLGDYLSKFQEEQIDMETLKMCSEGDLKEMGLPMGPRKKLLSYIKNLSEKQRVQQSQVPPLSPQVGHKRESVASVSYAMGGAGTGQLSVTYPKIHFQPSCFFALGSPIAMFLVVRGNETLGEDFKLPTCPAFFNIFHPFDPVAYRMENLIDPNFTACPVLIPHHKGRKRMHLELKESLSRMGSDLKQRFMDSLRYTWNSLNEFARAHRSSPAQVEAEVDRVLQEEISRQEVDAAEAESTVTASDLQVLDDIGVGQLNGGRRIDYVLQEKPIESFNEYLFALASHACYWESEDTVLLILKELYGLQGFTPQLPSSRPASQPKVQLYNPAVPVGSTSASEFPPPLRENSTAASGLCRPLPSADALTPPPPLQGFVRVSPLIRK